MAYLEFDNEEFARLLELAKGKRSINKFGTDTGVDPGYISRLLRKLTKTPPGAAIINKLASRAQNGVTLEQLMICAGYLALEEEASNEENEHKLSEQLTYLIFQEIAEKHNIDLTDPEQRQTVEDAFKLIFGRKKTN